VVFVNVKAGARPAMPRVKRLAELLVERGFHAEVLSDFDAAADRANRAYQAGTLRALVAAGGDGTVAALVNRTLAGVPITVLPSGTENLLARHFHLGRRPESCCRTIAAGRARGFDAGSASGKLFLLMAGCGFDADIVARVHRQRTGHIDRTNYFKPIFETIRNYQYPELRVEWLQPGDGSAGSETAVTSARWLFAFNLPRYAVGLRVIPDADADDGLLDVCTFRHGGLLHGLWYAGAVLLRQQEHLADYQRRRACRLRVSSAAEVPYQLDGDPGGVLPVEIEVLPGRLTLLTPAE
jgi:diacylglycerol kinase family enzyme